MRSPMTLPAFWAVTHIPIFERRFKPELIVVKGKEGSQILVSA